ncbi:unnamed protein product [Spodoptera littoralis]|uniref:Uncharacterized protein n=1 Tax=Spodoptera littoralis TaxID=7109 RepID=A0A9P0N4K3_SPOLI|nr:unnamed protein product [Spodoptera littoralis]CAH1642227.1 unnamed protein product [Spodoptera littoralis]
MAEIFDKNDTAKRMINRRGGRELTQVIACTDKDSDCFTELLPKCITMAVWTSYVHDWGTFTDQASEQYMIRPLMEKDIKAAFTVIAAVILDDNIFNVLDFRSDKVSIESLLSFVKEHLKPNLTFGCFKKDANELIGVDVIYIRNINDNDIKYGPEYGETFCKYMKYLKFVERRLRYNVAAKYVKYLTSLGLFILPEYRETDIEKYMLRIRKKVASHRGIVVNGAALIGRKIKKNAKELKYKVFEEIREVNVEGTDLEYLRGAAVFPITIVAMTKFGTKPKSKTVPSKRAKRSSSSSSSS